MITEQNNGMVATQSKDEIDLIELVISVWHKKWWVILFTVIFACLSATYALLEKEQWTSKAEVIAPHDFEIAHILKDRLEYARITDSGVGNVRDRLYGAFMTELRSVNSRVGFIKQSELYKKLAEGMNSESEKQIVLRELSSRSINIQWPDNKKEIDYPIISFSAQTPEDAQKTLSDYLMYLNNSAFSLVEKEFLINLNSQIDGLKFSLKRIEERLPQERNVKLETRQKNLTRALSTAKAAGIKEYSKTKIGENFVIPDLALGEAGIKLSDDQLSNNNFLFLMGEKYLQAQIDNVEKIPLVFPAEYYFKKTQLQQLQQLLSNKKDYSSDQSFHYQSAPYLPLQRDKPNRTLIVLIGTFLGGVLGVLVALLMVALASRKKRLEISATS